MAVESAGLPGSAAGEVLVTRFNDTERLRDTFLRMGGRLACFIVEPFIGSGGYILAEPEYLRAARQLADQYGVMLIFDEVISGFRFRAGDLGTLYGVRPDLATFAKIMGGGMPVAAIAGRRRHHEALRTRRRRQGARSPAAPTPATTLPCSPPRP